MGVLLLATALVSLGCGGKEASAPASNSGSAYLALTDAAGRKVVLPGKPERVVALSPSFLGMINAVDGRIVGRTMSKNAVIPEGMKAVPEVGMVYNVNMEALVALRPDLVLASKNQHDKFIPILESNKINVIELNTKTYAEVKDAVKLLGDVYGTQEKAAAEIKLMDDAVTDIVGRLPKDKKRIVIMHATANSVTVEGAQTIAGCVSDLLGFENVAAAALKGSSTKTPYSMESLVGQNPEIIFITSMGKAEEIESRLRKDFKDNPAWNSIPAVRDGRVYALPENLFLLNPGLAYPEAVMYMAKQVYPEVYKDGK